MCAKFLRRCRLRPPAPAGDDLAGHLARARVAEIGLLRTAARVGEVDAHHRTLASSTSLPQLSHTSLVTRATDFLLEFGAASCVSLAKAPGIRRRLVLAAFSRSEAGS